MSTSGHLWVGLYGRTGAMVITKMTATFGCLDGAEITFQEGLNIIHAPNEFGKSTWSAFLLAMLYGVETSQRSTKTSLAVKDKYKPWNGKPMAGTVEILWDGEAITLQRTTKGKNLLGVFRGFYTDSGLEVPGMTGENCGQMLLGVGRNVYARSGFVGQQAVTIGPDDSLEAQLMSLVTQGEDDVSYSQTQKMLNDLRNRRRHNRTGLLPQAENQREEIRQTIEKLSQIAQGNPEILGEIQAKKEQYQEIEAGRSAQKQWENQEKLQQVKQAKEQWEAAKSDYEALAQDVAKLPSKSQAEQWLTQLDQISAQKKLLEEEEALQTPEPPKTPQGFSHRGQLPGHLDALDAPLPQKPGNTVFMILAVAGLILLAMCFLVGGIVPIVGLIAVVLMAVAWWKKGKDFERKELEARQKKEEILLQYGVSTKEALLLVAKKYDKDLEDYSQAAAQASGQKERLARQQEALETQVAQMLEEMAHGETLAEGKAYARHILTNHSHVATASQVASQAKSTYEAVAQAVGDVVEVADCPLPKTNYTAQDLARCGQELTQLEGQLQHRYGQMSTLGDLGILEATEQDLTEKINGLQREYDALTLAMSALEEANSHLQGRLSPQVNTMAGQYLNTLTGGKYDSVFVGQSMSLETKEVGEIPLHTPLQLSGGTADQLYLAVRLAICQLLLREEAPLILDDALAFFDDTRMKKAVKLLRELGKTRQIILFSCHSRENRA